MAEWPSPRQQGRISYPYVDFEGSNIGESSLTQQNSDARSEADAKDVATQNGGSSRDESQWRSSRSPISTVSRRVSFEPAERRQRDRENRSLSARPRSPNVSFVRSAPDMFDTDRVPGSRLNPILEASRGDLLHSHCDVVEEDDEGYDEDRDDSTNTGPSVDEDENGSRGTGTQSDENLTQTVIAQGYNARNANNPDRNDNTSPAAMCRHTFRESSIFREDEEEAQCHFQHESMVAHSGSQEGSVSSDFSSHRFNAHSQSPKNAETAQSGQFEVSNIRNTREQMGTGFEDSDGADEFDGRNAGTRHRLTNADRAVLHPQDDEHTALLRRPLANSSTPPFASSGDGSEHSDSPDALFQTYGGTSNSVEALDMSRGGATSGSPFRTSDFGSHDLNGEDDLYYGNDGSQDQFFMGTRGEDFPLYEEDDHKAAFIIGTGSLAVFTVVVAVIVSGLTALLGVDVEDEFDVFSDWKHGGRIPMKYGCFAEGGVQHSISVPLQWINVPPETSTLVVLVANPGAIEGNGTDPVHWFLTNIPVEESRRRSDLFVQTSDNPRISRSHRISDNVAITRSGYSARSEAWSIPPNSSRNLSLMPKGVIQRNNSVGSTGVWYPLCAPPNQFSLYIVYIYAVDAIPVIADYKDARQIMNRFSGVPTAKLAGYYGRLDDESTRRKPFGKTVQ